MKTEIKIFCNGHRFDKFDQEMPKCLISGKFNEGIRVKRFWSCFESDREYKE